MGQSLISDKIYRWKQDNLRIVRVQKHIDEEKQKEARGSSFVIASSHNRNLSTIIGDGVGESLLLAKKLGLALYSDDVTLRSLAKLEYHVDSFCTISFLARIKKESKIKLAKEMIIYSKMIKDNFRTIPFRSDHLFSALERVLEERGKNQLPIPSGNELVSHEILGQFLMQFADSSLDYRSLENIAIDWWLKILTGYTDYRLDLLEKCMEFISFCLCTQRTTSGVLTGIKAYENAHRAARLWGLFLARCTTRDSSLNLYAWNAIRTCCKGLFPDNQQKEYDILYKIMPYHIVRIIFGDKKISENEKATYLFRITESLKYEPDKDKLEEGLVRSHMRYKGAKISS